MNLSFSILLVLGWLSVPFSLLAVERHVPQNFATLQEAIDSSRGGDIIMVDPGTYAGSLRFQGKNVILRAAGGPMVTSIQGSETPTIDLGPGGEVAGFTVTSNDRFDGTKVVLHGRGSVLHGNIFLGNDRSDAGIGQAVKGHGVSPVIDGNIFSRNRCADPTTQGVLVITGHSFPRITNNVFEDNFCGGLEVTPSIGIIANNTLVRNFVGIHLDGPDSRDTYFRNNILFRNGTGLLAHSPPESTSWENNLVSENDYDYTGMDSLTGILGNISSNPRFVDFDRGDYHLEPNSPAINKGTFNSAPEHDLEGAERPCNGAIDIGAFERCLPDATPLSPDCNRNDTSDAEDIRAGRSRDCNGNGVPDECDLDFGWKFSVVTEIPAWFATRVAFASDFDGDGDLDIAVGADTAEPCPSNSGVIAIHLNDGRGQFSPEEAVSAGCRPEGIIAGDFDGDGDNDMATVSYQDASYSIFLNQGDGRFENKPGEQRLFGQATSVAAADLDGDGDLDLAITDNGIRVNLLSNDGKGKFGEIFPVGTRVGARDILAADLDSDGDIDLVTANDPDTNPGVSSITVWRNDGTGKTFDPSSYDTPNNPFSIVGGDFDGDSFTDIAVTNSSHLANSVSVFKNQGSGSLASAVTYAVGHRPISITRGDIDGDKDIDLIVANFEGESLSLLVNTSGAFGRRLDVPLPHAPLRVIAADFDGDGDADPIAVYRDNHVLGILRNRTEPPTSKDQNKNAVPDGCELQPFRRGDANSDGRVNLADPISILNGLFRLSLLSPCEEAADANKDSVVSVDDGVFLIHYIFLSGPAPPEPFSSCGDDVSLSGLTCLSFPPCR